SRAPRRGSGAARGPGRHPAGRRGRDRGGAGGHPDPAAVHFRHRQKALSGFPMKTFLVRFICRLLAVSLIALPYTAQTQAGMIGIDEALAAQRQAERGKVRGFLARADVQKQLAVLGVDPAAATEPADALTDDEV